MAHTVRLVRRLPVPVHRVWAAWTAADQLAAWWGPPEVETFGVEVDLRVGGAYAIGHRFADGSVRWLRGHFETVDPDRTLVYSWRMDGSPATERVTVTFDAHGDGTEVTVVHVRIPDEPSQVSHRLGWQGCLDGLERWLRS